MEVARGELSPTVSDFRDRVCDILLQVQALEPPIMQEVLLDLPGLLFFSTYTLLVLFWAEIYHQARSLSTTALRPIFVAFNGVVYAVQVIHMPIPSHPTIGLCSVV
jgi:hypothetical protein